ncbi:MAG: hypothetical protein JW874_11395 [Spirochaetales bacterium]|nr:hypothetical protein [Spirochaetales bacterium]
MKTKAILGVAFLLLLSISCKLFEPGLGQKVDIEAPLLEVSDPENGEYVSGTVTISGTYSEDTGVDSIGLSFDGGTNFLDAEIDTADSTWSYELNTTLYSDGELNIIIKITDTDAKSTESQLLVRIDNTPPMVLVKNPLYYATSVFNGDISLKGEATDTFGIASVEVNFFDSAGAKISIGNATSAAAIDRLNDLAAQTKPQKSKAGRKGIEKGGSVSMNSHNGSMPAVPGVISGDVITALFGDLGSRAIADGTNSWSFLFPSKTYITTTGEYSFEITARDYANNVSTVIYHYNDVLDRNSSQSVTIEDLYRISRGLLPSASGVVITQEDLAEIALTELPLTINQALDTPEFIISNPDPLATPEENVLPGNARAIGMVTDDDGVDPDTIEICVDPADTGNPSAAGNTWVSVDDTSGSGLSVRFEHDLSALTDGSHQIWITADDIYGNTGYSSVVDFSIDRGAPTITVTSPAQGDYINDDPPGYFTIIGTASDGDSVASVEVSLDNGVSYDGADLAANKTDWTYDVTVTADAILKIKVRATDSTGKESYFNLLVITDITAPAVSFVSPLSTTTVNGEVIFKGTANDSNQLDDVTGVRLIIEKNGEVLTPDGIYNWTYTMNTVAYAGLTWAYDMGGGVWRLNLRAEVYDVAGNLGQTSGYYILIDNDLDKPSVNIVSPSEGKILGGSVLITGTAFDDDMVHHVEMQMDINGDGLMGTDVGAIAQDLWNGTSATLDGDTNDKFEDETQWYTVSGTTSWTEQINVYGELYDSGNLTIRVRAVDTKDSGTTPDTAGNYAELHITLDDTIPRVENLSHVSGDYVKGTFTLTGDILDDEFVNYIGISYNGGTNYTIIKDTDGSYNSTYLTKNGDDDYHLDMDIDTTAYIATSGILYFRIKVIDDANYQSISYLNLNVDNEAPSGAWDPALDAEEMENDDVTGLTLVQGTMEDPGAVGGYGKVEVYFIDGTAVYNPKGGADGTHSNVTFSNGSFPYPDSAAYIINIDDLDEFGDDDNGNGTGDGDGYDENIQLLSGTYTWSAEFDSLSNYPNNIPDGELEIHYVVYDTSLNATHYQIAGFFKNDRPEITTLTVGTDLDFSGAVNTGTAEDWEYSTTFDVRNLVYVDIDATDGGTIDDWEVRLVSGDTLLTPVSGGAQTQPELGATYNFSAYADGTAIALYAQVVDDTGISTREYFDVIIDNDDDVAGPTGTFDPFTAASVVAAAGGHVEAIGESRDYDDSSGTNPYNATSFSADATADLSGTVYINGSLSDDQRIDIIELKINGYDPDGGAGVYGSGDWFELATWNVSTRQFDLNTDIPNYATAISITSEFDPVAGHTAEFSFTWNTADIDTVTAEDVDVSLRVTDRGTTEYVLDDIVSTPTADGDPLTVDVVPYISYIDRNDTVNQTRTHWGKYTLKDAATNVLITGYNLNPDFAAIYNTAGSSSTNLSASIGDIAGDYTSFTIDLTGTAYNSGYLWIADGTVIAINNFNDNDLEQNSQYEPSDPETAEWNDDLYIELWNVDNEFHNSVDAAHPALGVNSDGTLYAAWSNYTNSARRYGTDAAYRSAYGPGPVYDPPEWNDIAFNHDNNDNFFIVNLWNQLVTPTFQGLRIHSFEGTGMNDNTNSQEIDHLDGLYQYRNPRIAVKDSTTDQTILYISYYDVAIGALKFARYTYDESANSLTANTTGINFTVDDTGDVGLYSDIAVDSSGNPFIVYYDTTNQRLKIAYASDDDPNTSGEWTITTINSGVTYYGEYVSVAVDATGNIHIATYRNATGDLLYLTAASVAAASFSVTTVDDDGAVGVWPEISIVGGNPYISYINSSQASTFYGLKYAYLNGSDWEVGTVPVEVSVASIRTGIVPKPSGATLGAAEDYTVAVGYSAGYYYFARLRPEE